MSEGYLFNYNSVYYAYTPEKTAKTWSNITFNPIAIQRRGFTLTDNFFKSEEVFTFDLTNSFAKELLLYLPEFPITVDIYIDGVIHWHGKVIDTSANPTTIEVVCNSNFTNIERTSTLPKLYPTCNRILYGQGCNVAQNNYANVYSISNLSSSTFTLTTGRTSGYFDNGIASLNGQTRRIITHVNTIITLSYAFNGVQTGNLILYPGCNLTEENCLNKFNNIINFLGASHSPTRNPWQTGIQNGSL